MIFQAADCGTTVFENKHYMDEAEYCNRVSIMVEGEEEEVGKPDELKKKY